MSIKYIVVYNPTPFKFGGLKWDEQQIARKDARARDEKVENILRDIAQKTKIIQAFQRLDVARFLVTFDDSNFTIFPVVIRTLRERGCTISDNQVTSL